MSENSLFELYKRGKITEEELKRATGMDKVYRNYKNDKSHKKDENETKDFSITNFNNDWQGLIDKIGWQDYVNADEIENSLANIYNILSSDEGKTEILGLTTESTENGDIMSFAMKPYSIADCILTNSQAVFKRNKDYSYYRKLIDDNKSTLDSLVINFDVTISEEGFLKEISADNLGIKFNLKISDIKS